MPTETSDLIAASRALDPAGRALLNLWLHRGLDDRAIAQLSGGSPADVADRRRVLVEQLAQHVGASPRDVRARLDELAGGPAASPSEPPELITADELEPTATAFDLVLPGEPAPGEAGDPEDLVLPGEAAPAPAFEPELVVPGEPEPPAEPVLYVPGEPEPRPEPELVLPSDPEPRPEAEPPRLVVPASAEVGGDARDRPAPARRSAVPVVLGVAVGLILVAMIFIGALTDEDAGERAAATPTPAATSTPAETPTPAATAAAPPPVPLAAVTGGPGGPTGSVTVRGDGLRLDVNGLERPGRDYEVWLFNDIGDARSLGRLDRQPLRLPPDAGRYRFLDVSLEPGENPNHSGRSVLRADRPR